MHDLLFSFAVSKSADARDVAARLARTREPSVRAEIACGYTACAQALLAFVGDCKNAFGADALSPVRPKNDEFLFENDEFYT